MEWLTNNKIPVGDTAEIVFDWLQRNGTEVFDAISDGMEATIDTLLWIFQTPHPLIIIAVFVADRKSVV